MQKLRLGIVLALCMLLVVSAFATETETATAGVSITAADVTADANGEAVVVITVDSGDTAVAAVLFTVGPENVAVKSVEAVPGAYADEAAASGWGFVPQTNNEGKLPMNLAFINAAAQDATLKATVTLTLEGITEDVDLTITGEASAMGTADDADGVAVPVTATGATITVKPACDHTNTVITYTYNDATHTGVCACGETVVENEEHNLNEVADSAVAPSFTAAGKEADQACVCGYTVTGEEIPMLVAKAYIGETPYETVQDAVDAVAVLGTVTVVDGVTATVTPAKTFYLAGDIDGITIAGEYVMDSTYKNAYENNRAIREFSIIRPTETKPMSDYATVYGTNFLALEAAIELKSGLDSDIARQIGIVDMYAIATINAGTELERSFVVGTEDRRLSDGYDYYVATFPMVKSTEFKNDVTFDFYGITAEGKVLTRTRTTTVADYCTTMFPSADANFKKLLAAILNYGSTANVNFQGITEGLPNEALSSIDGDYIKTAYGDFDGVTATKSYKKISTTGENVILDAASYKLVCEDAVILGVDLYVFDKAIAAGLDDISFVATYTSRQDADGDGAGDLCTVVIPYEDWIGPNPDTNTTKAFRVDIEGIKSVDIRQTVRYGLYRDYDAETGTGTLVSDERLIGIEEYSFDVFNKTDAKLQALCAAILDYCDAACNYFTVIK